MKTDIFIEFIRQFPEYENEAKELTKALEALKTCDKGCISLKRIYRSRF